MMRKFICTVCGYIHEGEEAPEECPICKAPTSKFKEVTVDGVTDFATVHELGVAYRDKVPQELIDHCKVSFAHVCSEVGMYLAMARQADREGHPEVARTFEHYSYEKANHASRYAELLGDILKDTKSNLETRIEAEKRTCAEKFEVAQLAKRVGSDALHDTIHEMAKDDARHAAGFIGLYTRYFK